MPWKGGGGAFRLQRIPLKGQRMYCLSINLVEKLFRNVVVNIPVLHLLATVQNGTQ